MTDLLHGQPYRVIEGDCLQRLRELPDGCCDCCGKYMIDDCERGCGTCYECQAWIAKTTEQETTPCDPQAPPAPDAPSPS